MNVLRRVSMRCRQVLAVSALVVAVPTLSAADPLKTGPIGFQSLSALSITQPSGLGANGLVVGQLNKSGQLHAATGVTGAPVSDLGTLGGNYSSASASNASGTVVGESNLADNTTTRGFVLQPGGTMQDVGTLGGNTSTATGINDAGQVVGGAAIASGETRGFVRSTGGTLTNVGTLGGNYSIANGINAFGLVVGQSNTSGGDMHAFSYKGGTIKDLGTLGGNFSVASGVNNGGQVVGQSFTANNAAAHAFLYDGTKMNDLGTLSGFSASAADSINNSGQVVGKMYGMLDPKTGKFLQHAFIYSNGVMTDLNSLVPSSSGMVLNEATGIDDQGRIVGIGTLNGKSQAFLITVQTVPEPTTLVAFGILGALVLARKLRQGH